MCGRDGKGKGKASGMHPLCERRRRIENERNWKRRNELDTKKQQKKKKKKKNELTDEE